VGFTHADSDIFAHYFKISTTSAAIHIAPGHHLFVNGNEVDPATVLVGDKLNVALGGMGEVEEEVLHIEKVIAQGAYHPITPNGKYFVDGVLASVYESDMLYKPVAKYFMPYVLLRYYIGLPIVIEPTRTLLDPIFVVDSVLQRFGAASVPIALCAGATAEVASSVWQSAHGMTVLGNTVAATALLAASRLIQRK
jgi:hypothetical protein